MVEALNPSEQPVVDALEKIFAEQNTRMISPDKLISIVEAKGAGNVLWDKLGFNKTESELARERRLDLARTVLRVEVRIVTREMTPISVNFASSLPGERKADEGYRQTSEVVNDPLMNLEAAHSRLKLARGILSGYPHPLLQQGVEQIDKLMAKADAQMQKLKP